MKRILFLISFLIISVAGIAQERTVILNNGNFIDLRTTSWTAYNWSGSLDNLVPTTRDTIDFVVLVKNQNAEPLNFFASITLTPITTADTTVAITVSSKMFESGTYADVISSALTSAISSETIINKTSLGVVSEKTFTTAGAVDLFRGSNIKNNDTLTVSSRVQTVQYNTALFYRYLRFRLIISGNDHTGTGIKVKRLEINFFN